jgi:hypothetical protein
MTNLFRTPWTFRENGEANSYALIGPDRNWVVALLINGEIITPTQIRLMRMIAKTPDLLDLLCEALPLVEDALDDPVYTKSGKAGIRKLIMKIRKAIEEAETP